MELTAAIKALEYCVSQNEKQLPLKYVRIFTDSTYVKDGITVWVKNWENNNWKTSDKKNVKNVDLWKKLRDLDCLNNLERKEHIICNNCVMDTTDINITFNSGTPKAKAFLLIIPSRSILRSTAIALAFKVPRNHSIPIDPQPAPISHSICPGMGAKDETVIARTSRLVN